MKPSLKGGGHIVRPLRFALDMPAKVQVDIMDAAISTYMGGQSQVQVAKQFGISAATISSELKRRGIALHTAPVRRYTEAEKQESISLYLAGYSLREAERRTGCDRNTILRTLKSKGIELRKQGEFVRDEQVNNIERLYTEGLTAREIAVELGTYQSAVKAIIRRYGMKKTPFQSIGERESVIVERYRSGQSVRAVAKECAVNERDVVKLLAKQGVRVRNVTEAGYVRSLVKSEKIGVNEALIISTFAETNSIHTTAFKLKIPSTRVKTVLCANKIKVPKSSRGLITGSLSKKDAGRHYALLSNYGITISEYELMLNAQGGACKICKGMATHNGVKREVPILFVDHCHLTGQIRGLLCGNCNSALGLFRDNPDYLREAATYIEEANKQNLYLLAMPDLKSLFNDYEKGVSFRELAKRQGLGIGVLKKLLLKEGLEVGDLRKSFSPDQIQEICGRYEKGEGTTILGRDFGVHPSTIYRLLIKAKVKTKC